MEYLHYGAAVGRIAADEPCLFQEIVDTFIKMGRTVEEKEDCAPRVSHAKVITVLTGSW